MKKTTHNSLYIDEKKFSQLSKSVQKNLKEQEQIQLSLSKTQEILAKSLGFRNLHGMQSFWKKERIIHSNRFEDKMDKISSGKWLNIISLFMPSSENMIMWQGRAISLLSSLLMTLSFMRENGEIKINSQTIGEYLIFENLLKLYKTRKDFPPHVLNSLKAYFHTLPTFEENSPKQNSTVKEQHDYLKVQLLNCLETIGKIEKDNFVLVPKELVKTLGLINKFKKLKENIPEDLVKKIHKLNSWPYFKYGWLSDSYLEDMIDLMVYEDNIEDITLGDVLLYASTLILQEQIDKQKLFLHQLTNNFEESKKHSDKLIAFIQE